MNFIDAQNFNGAPQLEQSGKLNLQDWKSTQINSSIHGLSMVKLPNGKEIKVSESPNLPSAEILALDDEELSHVANQGSFPEVWCLLFLRGLTEEVRAIAPMLSVHAFYDKHKDEISEKIQANLKSEESQEWVEYYASCLRDYPIFKTALFALDQEWRDKIGFEFFETFNDIKYLSSDQISSLTTEQKRNALTTVLKESQNDTGKRDIVLNLFTKEDVLDANEVAVLLGLTQNSTTCGALMGCVAFYSDKTNAYNTVATWIRHCVNEQIGTNQSVWYKMATDIETEHGFAISKDYIKNVQGQAIGGVSHVGAFGADMPIVKQSRGNIGPGTWI